MTTPAFAKTALARLRVLALRAAARTEATLQELANAEANAADVLACIETMELRIARLTEQVRQYAIDAAEVHARAMGAELELKRLREDHALALGSMER